MKGGISFDDMRQKNINSVIWVYYMSMIYIYKFSIYKVAYIHGIQGVERWDGDRIL